MLRHPTEPDEILGNFQSVRPLINSDPLWAYNEFSAAEFNDLRLTRRLQIIAHCFVQRPMASIPQACSNWAQSKATYRFCANDKVSLHAILAPHSVRTLERAGLSASSVILCPQDTTTLNYMAHPATQGLGHVGTKPGKSLGLLLHSTLAVSPQGHCFGLLHAHSWARSKRKRPRKTRSRYGVKIEDKETFRWLEGFRRIEQLAHLYPEHQWVSVNDREGDIYEIFQEATAPTHRAGLLTRARHDRALLQIPRKTLFQYMRGLSPCGTHTVRIPRHENQPARTVTLSVSFAAVNFGPPRYHEGESPLSLYAVWAEEVDPPAGQRPIRWCLLTNVPVRTLADAVERIEWYVKRWMIEEYHRILKSGCQVEARQLTTRQRLQRALGIDMVVAWRIMDLNKAARVEPNAPADRWLSTTQWQALYCYMHGTRQPPQKPPSIEQAVGWIAQLGGFLARKSDGRPGSMTLWRGMQRLNDIASSWKIFAPDASPPQRKSRRRKTAA